jgi:hypothetical protein
MEKSRENGLIMENPMKMDDLGVICPVFRKPPYEIMVFNQLESLRIPRV